MYATNAFALKKLVRELLIETAFPQGFRQELEDRAFDDFDNWSGEVQRQINKLMNTQKQIMQQIHNRKELAR